MWNDDIDPEVSAQFVQASAQAYLSLGKEKGKGEGKGKGKGRYLVRPSHLSLKDRRRRMEELKAKTECRASGRKGHWANDRESYHDTTTSFQPSEPGWSVFNSDDPDSSAYMVDQHVLAPTEPTEQFPLTPTASAADDTKKAETFDVHAIDDNMNHG